MDKRYQVFLSSTYADLKDERRRVLQTLMELDCIPAGMELFPAADEEQWAFIRRIIDDCDYYLLIIGGRYGSITSDGVSYTEKEYDYAVERGIRVLALIHEDPSLIPLGKSELDPVARARLGTFRDKVKSGRLVRFWKNADELPGLVSLSLSKTIKMYPAVGWIRADKAPTEALLLELNELRKETERLRKAASENRSPPEPSIDDIAGLDEDYEFQGSYKEAPFDKEPRSWSSAAAWRDIFSFIGPYVQRTESEYEVRKLATQFLFDKAQLKGFDEVLSENDFQTLRLQFLALRLVDIKQINPSHYSWTLTRQGEATLIKLRAVRSKRTKSPVQ